MLKNLAQIFLVLIPILFFGTLFAITRLEPQSQEVPQQQFLYTINNYRKGSSYSFSINDNNDLSIKKDTNIDCIINCDEEARIFVFNPETKISNQISQDEAVQKKYSIKNISDDGWQFRSFYFENSPFNFGGGVERRNVLTKTDQLFETEITTDEDGENVNFIAWITQN